MRPPRIAEKPERAPGDAPDRDDGEESLDPIRQVAGLLRIEAEFGGDWIPVTPRREPPGGPEPAGADASSPAPKHPDQHVADAGARRTGPLPRIVPAVRVESEPSRKNRTERLASIASEVARCKACSLHENRTKTVPGHGHPAPRLCFVGEGPGADEDTSGLPFVGRAGKLLDRMIAAMGLAREEVFVMNTVKCRPPSNRTPEPVEMKACNPFLERQLEILEPELIVALGRPAAQVLLGIESSLGSVRGRFGRHGSIPVLPTYHPAYLLRNPDAKQQAWADLKLAHGFLTGTIEAGRSSPDADGGRTPGSNGAPPSPNQGSLFT